MKMVEMDIDLGSFEEVDNLIEVEAGYMMVDCTGSLDHIVVGEEGGCPFGRMVDDSDNKVVVVDCKCVGEVEVENDKMVVAVEEGDNMAAGEEVDSRWDSWGHRVVDGN